jgi:predicted homoserine dehydrogenase-like protein
MNLHRCFQECGLKTDASGALSAMYEPFHLIGLELGMFRTTPKESS